MTVYICSDFHLGHKNLHTFSPRPIYSVSDNYDFIKENWVATKRDNVFLLGDIIFEDEAFDFIQSLPAAQKILVLGNHDYERFKPDFKKLISTFDDIKGVRSYKNTWLTHVPMHQTELRQKFINVHGHIHDATTAQDIADNPRYFNVNVDVLWPKYNSIMLDFQYIKRIALERIVVEEMVKTS